MYYGKKETVSYRNLVVKNLQEDKRVPTLNCMRINKRVMKYESFIQQINHNILMTDEWLQKDSKTLKAKHHKKMLYCLSTLTEKKDIIYKIDINSHFNVALQCYVLVRSTSTKFMSLFLESSLIILL